MRKRILWLDFIKGICIWAVLIEHVIYFSNTTQLLNEKYLQIFRGFLAIFMMPCFFAVSGYLYTPTRVIREYIILIYKKSISFGIPYIIFYILFAMFLSPSSFISKINPIIILTKPNGDLWFLYVLFIIFIIVGFMDLIRINKYLQFVAVIICLFIYLIFGNSFISMNLRMQHGILQMFNIVFFLIGEFIRKYMTFIKKIVIISTSMFIISFIICSFTKFSYDIQFISLNTIVPKMLSIFCIFGISSRINNINKLFKYFTRIGRVTLVIYIVHFIPLIYLTKLFNGFLISDILEIVIILFIVYCFSIFICHLSKRIKAIDFIFYPRRYINKFIIYVKKYYV